jgi:hypothetical protein
MSEQENCCAVEEVLIVARKNNKCLTMKKAAYVLLYLILFIAFLHASHTNNLSCLAKTDL